MSIFSGLFGGSAVDRLEVSAMNGDVSAQYAIAERYFNGEGVTQDIYKAIHWYAYAAENGHADAIRTFDRLYYYGNNVGYKMMGFWFERECITRTRIPPSVPYKLEPIKYTGNDNPAESIKAMLPWSEVLKSDYKISESELRDINSRKLFIVQRGEGFVFDPHNKSGILTGTDFNGSLDSSELSSDASIPKTPIDIAIRMGIIDKPGVLSMQLIELHKAFGNTIYRDCLGDNTSEDSVKRVFRFAFLKGMEQRVASDTYSNTKRHSSYDFYALREDCLCLDGSVKIITELPCHLDKAICSYTAIADNFASRMVKEKCLPDGHSIVATCLIGDYLAKAKGIASIQIKDYANADMLTMEEMRDIAGHVLLDQCVSNGGEILTSRFTRSCNTNAVVKYKDETRAYLLRATSYPNDIGFWPYELDRLYNGAIAHNCVPYIITASVASQNERHFADGVVMVGDKCKVMFTGSLKLEPEEVE